MDGESGNENETTVESSLDVRLPNVDAVSDVFKTRDWLDGQKYDLAVSLRAEELDLIETQDVEELRERISQLKSELYMASADHAVKNLIVEKAQHNKFLVEKMFSQPLPSTDDGENLTESNNRLAGEDHRKFSALLIEKKKLSSAVLRKHEAVCKLQAELDAVRRRNFELKKRNRSLMGVLKEHRQNLEKMAEEVKCNDACRGLREELENTVSRVEIAKHTLQALIVGSGVNWAKDADLVETVLLCGESMQL